MENISDFPFFRVHFNESGAFSRDEVDALLNHVKEYNPARVAVVSHGWRNDEDYAFALYRELFGNVASRFKDLQPGAIRPLTILGVFWPSMALPEFGKIDVNKAGDGIAQSEQTSPGLDKSIVAKQLDELAKSFGQKEKFDAAKGMLADLENSASKRKEFVVLLRKSAAAPTDIIDDNSNRFFSDDPLDVFERLMPPISLPPATAPTGGALGIGSAIAGVGDTLLNKATGALGAAFRLVNFLTYYQMKERAGLVGLSLNKVVGELRQQAGNLPIHLVGHSFGARVVTAAAGGENNLCPCTLSLLQGAFSHNGFASYNVWQKNGFFRNVFSDNRVNGPIIATHTANDQAVGVLYPIASRIAGQNATALGDANDPYGGLGRNGAIHLEAKEFGPETLLREPTDSYSFGKAKANNLLADRFIHDHGDVRNPAVANAVAQVILSL